ncbi:helix-turn-helix domain-containing protein [Pseudarthrobacter sp. B907]|uniref:helix-turn-helix transcriptional regulator n=1 Tax=Pseudarthrobacter sp. B907 TaxID=3158261 RepID=UPI0032DA0CA1
MTDSNLSKGRERTAARRYATLSAGSAYTGFSTRTLRRYIAQGRLTGYRVGPRHIRIDLNEVDGMFSAIPSANDAA